MSRLLLVAAGAALVIALGLAMRPAPETEAGRVARLSGELRCPVCQGLSVRDSQSDTARQMRDLIAQRVAEGRSDHQIRDEFRSSYGDWVVLDPSLLGPGGLVWIAPLVLLIAGLGVAWRLARGRPERTPPADPAAVRALRERVAREEAADR